MASLTDEVKAEAARETAGTAEYLGDGLYASFDGMHIELVTAREEGEHIVYLNHEVFTALLKYADKIGRWVHGWDE